jgi:hypothetical protein
MSRPRSPANPPGGRSAAAGRARGTPAAPPRRVVSVPQVQSDVYTALLAISLAAIVIGCALLAFHWSSYDFSLGPS